MHPMLDTNSEFNPALTLIVSVTMNIDPMLSLSLRLSLRLRLRLRLSLRTTGWSIKPVVEGTRLT